MTSHSHDLPQTVILTGGTSGVGYAYARTLAASHPDRHVVIDMSTPEAAAKGGYP